MVRKTPQSRSRSHQVSNQEDPEPFESGDLDLDAFNAVRAGERADSEIKRAEGEMNGIAKATANAQDAIYRALRAAQHAETAAGWVLEDARRMMNAARLRSERVRAMFRTEGTAVEDLDAGSRAIGQAEQGEVRAIESSLREVDRAMRAASQAQRRMDGPGPVGSGSQLK